MSIYCTPTEASAACISTYKLIFNERWYEYSYSFMAGLIVAAAGLGRPSLGAESDKHTVLYYWEYAKLAAMRSALWATTGISQLSLTTRQVVMQISFSMDSPPRKEKVPLFSHPLRPFFVLLIISGIYEDSKGPRTKLYQGWLFQNHLLQFYNQHKFIIYLCRVMSNTKYF